MRTFLRLLVATVLTVAVVGGVLAVRGGEDDDGGSARPEPPATSPPPPSLAEVDTASLVVARAGFCEAVPPEAVTDALGGEATRADAYGNGERAALADGVQDVAHEFGCVWSSAAGSARAWVFAPPVSATDAVALRRAATREDGCRAIGGAAAFGEPGVALVCRADGGPVASYRGLFGDAWLACSVRGADRADAEARADRWCAAVAVAASSAPPD